MPSRHRPCRELAGLAINIPSPRPHSRRLDVKRGLLVGRGEGPCGAGAALLAEDEAHLLRRPQLRLAGTVGRAGLLNRQGTETVDLEEAVLACDLLRGPPGRACALLARHLRNPRLHLD